MPEDLFIAFRLSKEGFGRPDEILAMPSHVVLAALDYVDFEAAYACTWLELNKNTHS
ncbi:hypothetical protein [Ereboglobus luteus]|uniref:hypothetical protein n=1 Tax=Ereboglobus luteus TaxID=1796921 RepID=UPI0013749FE1|nr:hypothetical protein [Ereboglobus luteus]